MTRSRQLRTPQAARPREAAPPPPPQQLPPWKWPGQWVRSESWWREVSTRTAAAVLTVVIVASAGVAAGYIQRPTLRETALLVANLVLFPVVLVGYLRMLKESRHWWTPRRTALILALVVGLSVLASS